VSDERVHGGGVTVVVPHYGDPGPTRATIGDLLAQATDRTVEIVVADDCSPEPFPDADGVTGVRRTTNGGFGSAVNSGAEVATQPLLLVLNSDVALAPTFVEDLVTAAEPWLPAVVRPVLLDTEGHPSTSARHFPPSATRRSSGSPRWPGSATGASCARRSATTPARCRGRSCRATGWWGRPCLLPTETFRMVGSFDESFCTNSEEIDLQRRLHESRLTHGGRS
jgi:N-acetylglucosaminyl-diphospho-decaprenol L-rhamnosyltransferase